MRLLAQVQEEPGLLLRELASRTQLHENTVRDHLLVLEAEGLITRTTVHAGTRGRPPEIYHPVREPDRNPQAARRVEQAARHGDLYRRMRGESPPTELEPDALHQIDTLYEHLDDSGLQPELDDAALRIDLVPCPFSAAGADEPELVCRVHAQLIRDTLSQVAGPVRLHLLEPHLGQRTCRVHLTAADPAEEQRGDQARAVPRSIPATTSAPAPTSTSSHRPSA
jgi:predicted ArsR family transcriptional regulator